MPLLLDGCPTGLATMAPAMAEAHAYHRWIGARVAPLAGRRVLDLGAGHGDLLALFLDRERLIALDQATDSVARLRARFRGNDRVRVLQGDFLDPRLRERLAGEALDTILCLNVLEHQADDRAALAAIRALLPPETGTLILQVPAHLWLMGSLDRAAGHYRRYARRDLRSKLEAAGFRVHALRAMNLVGIAGWWYSGRLRRHDLTSPELNDLVRFFDRWVAEPARRIESVLPPPIGLSLFATAS